MATAMAPAREGSPDIEAIAELTLEQLSRTTEVRVRCRDGSFETLHVGPLYLDQLLGLAAALGEGMDAARTAVNGLQRYTMAKDDKTGELRPFAIPITWTQMVMAIIPAVEPEVLAKILAVLTDRTADWCRENCDLLAISQIVDAVGDHNPPEQIMSAFRHAGSRWSQRQPAASIPPTGDSSTEPASQSATSDDTASDG